MMLNSKSIGNKIAAARKKINFSQSELAQQVSISSQAVGKWERGESMPDITTLNRLAEILGVDLNYFSDSFLPINHATEDAEETNIKPSTKQNNEPVSGSEDRSAGKAGKKLNWDMSKLNLVDSDFSGLKNLHEKFSSSNMQRCLFVGSNMSGLVLDSNNVDTCDFRDSDISNSKMQSSNLTNNIFKNCSLKVTEFSKCNINVCDFSDADLTETIFRSGNFMENILTNAIWKNTAFIEMKIQDVVFEGAFEDCFFENCSFYGVKFKNATLTNTFFKYNRKLNRVQFIDCKADNLTYAFLKSGKADLTGITLLS